MSRTHPATTPPPGPDFRRVYLEMPSDLLARVDLYCAEADRSRNAGLRYLIGVALKLWEEGRDS